MAKFQRTSDPISVALPRLLAEREISLRELGRMIGVSQSYLSRIRSPKDNEGWRPPSKKTLVAIAEALDLRPDYFPEYRQLVVEEAIATDGRTRDRFYDLLRRSKS